MAEVIRRQEVTIQRQYPRYGSYKVSAPVIKCDCGKEVVCSAFTNACSCGRDYNMSGSQLAPRRQWGEETGETANDIISGTSYNDGE
jgi:hypothetical protein